MTGYPSLDRPWLKNYTEKALNSVQPETTMYGYVYDNNKDYADYVALEYYGHKFTYAQFFEKVETVAKAFVSLGIKEGDVVTIMSMHTPETIFSIYALNRIGAVANMIYMTLTENDIIKYVTITKSVAFMYLDIIGERLKPVLDKLGVPVIVLKTTESMSFPINVLVSLKLKPKSYGTTFAEFIANTKKDTVLPDIDVKKDRDSIIIYTSGTTGEPKGVVHTNHSLNAVSYQYDNAGMELYHGDTILNSAPPFLGFGLSFGMHTQLSLGWHGILQIVPKAEDVAKAMNKYKPKHMIIGPAFINAVTEACRGDMSWMVTMAGGGGAVTAEQEQKLNDTLAKHNCKAKYITAYGMTEFGSTVITNMDHSYKFQTLGIPLHQVNVMIRDPETEEEMKFNEIGEICIACPQQMKGYYGIDSSDVFFERNGARWLRTGDLGHVDEDGFVYCDGRIKRIYITQSADGTTYKIFPARVENELMAYEPVDQCGTIAVDKGSEHNVMTAFVSLKPGAVSTEDELMKYIASKVPEYSVPEKIVILDSMPTTQAGKIDYKELRKLL